MKPSRALTRSSTQPRRSTSRRMIPKVRSIVVDRRHALIIPPELIGPAVHGTRSILNSILKNGCVAPSPPCFALT